MKSFNVSRGDISQNNLSGIQPTKPSHRRQGGGIPSSPQEVPFAETLKNQRSIEKSQPGFKESEAISEQNKKGLLFSNHAVERMRSRGVQFDAEKMSQIEGALKKAEGKGAKNTLIVDDKAALIVDVAQKKVVTVMDKQALKENVFTKIDSTVII